MDPLLVTPASDSRRSSLRSGLVRVLPLRALSDPWVAAGAPALLFLILALRCAMAPVSDPDVWWIAVAGRDLLATGHVPTANVYGFTNPAHPWVMHEWLWAVPWALGLHRLGSLWVTLVGLLGGSVTFALVLRATVGACRTTATGASLALLALMGCRECLFSPRPGYLAFGLVLVCARLALDTPVWTLRATVHAVVLGALWTQLHGSFPLAIALLAAGAAAADGQRTARWGAVLLVAAVTLVNPYGLRLHGLVDRYLLGGDPSMALVHAHIAEFSPLWRPQWPFANGYALASTAVITLVAVHGGVRWRQHRARTLVVLSVVALGVLHVRHLALASLVGCALLVPVVDELLAGESLGTPGARLQRRVPQGAWLPGLLAGLVAATAVTHGGRVERVAMGLGGGALPALVARLPRNARVVAPFQSASRIVWLGPNGTRVLLDPRNDCFDAPTLTLGYALEDGSLRGDAARTALAAVGADHALAPVGSTLAEDLAGATDWRVAARAENWLLYARGR